MVSPTERVFSIHSHPSHPGQLMTDTFTIRWARSPVETTHHEGRPLGSWPLETWVLAIESEGEFREVATVLGHLSKGSGVPEYRVVMVENLGSGSIWHSAGEAMGAATMQSMLLAPLLPQIPQVQQ